ncbi:hypothetical protein MKW98_004065 [Papaver atlanticum]|uniref:Uncharacterized protein n=1 Tax=Papaver atlanticum TaxID=357466 RepID=A0AAD4SYK2_9MAGN|nr:hypothetical protein MKW98_004065 [Papaver atlanticum]
MKTPIRKQLQQRNPPSNSSNPPKRTANLLHHESKDIASESPSPTMISPANEEVKVTFPDTESSIESFEMLDSDLFVSPTTDEIVSESPSQMMTSSESKETSPDTGSSIESSEILDSDLLVSPTTDENLVFNTDSSRSTSSTSYSVNSAPAKSDESQTSTATEISKVIININLNFPHSSSSEIINSSANVSPNESSESEAEMMMMVDLLKRSGTDLNRLKSLLKIDDTNLKDDLSELMSGKVQIGITCFVIWIGVLLVILLRKSSCELSDSLTPPT